MKSLISEALIDCKAYAVSIFCVYFVSCAVGILMAHQGNQFALAQRDRIVGAAMQTDKAAIEYQAGNNFSAAVRDFAGNVLFAAIPQTLLGFGVVPPYFTVAYQGWVGGIVSVDGSHRSRFTNTRTTAYYFLVLLLQTVAFSLSIGAGIKCGVSTYKYNAAVGWKFWNLRIPKGSLARVCRVYVVSLPLFLVASCFEFLSKWNM